MSVPDPPGDPQQKTSCIKMTLKSLLRPGMYNKWGKLIINVVEFSHVLERNTREFIKFYVSHTNKIPVLTKESVAFILNIMTSNGEECKIKTNVEYKTEFNFGNIYNFRNWFNIVEFIILLCSLIQVSKLYASSYFLAI